MSGLIIKKEDTVDHSLLAVHKRGALEGLQIHICWTWTATPIWSRQSTPSTCAQGAVILIFIVEGASATSSFCMRSPIPGNMVDPPDSTTLPYCAHAVSALTNKQLRGKGRKNEEK